MLYISADTPIAVQGPGTKTKQIVISLTISLHNMFSHDVMHGTLICVLSFWKTDKHKAHVKRKIMTLSAGEYMNDRQSDVKT